LPRKRELKKANYNKIGGCDSVRKWTSLGGGRSGKTLSEGAGIPSIPARGECLTEGRAGPAKAAVLP